ncbi:putative P2Y purinoceptor 10 [Epinephelus fuscoguttatus]|uniref:putative P2Y purinoceptor 10 n=1 Tax=Epinephelus fuscoguttatus TaxID=293821 RepID=UPI0020D1863A|nr:putative P2Y purinoceptor 10 [Epinephelus fuscoguttatus]
MRQEMTLNMSGASPANSSCGHNMTSWDQRMDKMYTYFYLLLFIPGLLLNTTALWVLCRHISKKTKAVIFMINLALADLAHILSLPLRIYYYFTHTWPFGRGICLFCFYLKYLNMYAAIVFLVCISVQRCVFLLDPFSARRWRRRYDLLISLIVWVVVGLACSPFILMRSSSSNSSTSPSISTQTVYNMSYSLYASSTQQVGYTKLHVPPTSMSPSSLGPGSSPSSTKVSCFKDLPMRRLSLSLAVTMITLAELFGFIIPLACITFSSIRITRSLNQKNENANSTTLNSSARSRIQSVTSNGHTDKYHEKQINAEKRRALRMVLSCSALFLFCFAPYHLNFLLYLMVSQDVVSHCATRLAVRQFHPVSLCLASLSCCLNPLLYYFLNAEFRLHLTRRTSSFTASLLSSPISSPIQRPTQHRMTSMESSCSDREQHYSDANLFFPKENDTAKDDR